MTHESSWLIYEGVSKSLLYFVEPKLLQKKLQDIRKKVSDNFAAVLKINIGKLTWLLFSTICCMGKFERLWENPDVNFLCCIFGI